MAEPPCPVTRTETICRTHVKDVCVKPRAQKVCRTPDLRCDQTVVQTKPGGYRWKQTPNGCWKYCYEPPCYQWCNKVVTKKGIEYCTETPPEYKAVAWTEPVQVSRQTCTPAKYKVAWRKELYTPGHWEWQPSQACGDCECPTVCPKIPVKRRPCAPRVAGAPSTN